MRTRSLCHHLPFPPGRTPSSLSLRPISKSSSDGAIGGVLGSPLSPTSSGTTLMVLSETFNLSEEEPEEMIAFDTQPVAGRLPNSSYSWEDNLFTWTDITGQYASQW